MAEEVFYGVVRGNVVVLSPGVRLSDGLRVEVHAPAGELPAPESPAAEEEVLRRLVAAGLLRTMPAATRPPLAGDRTPIHATGRPISEMIIEERR